MISHNLHFNSDSDVSSIGVELKDFQTVKCYNSKVLSRIIQIVNAIQRRVVY